jgi:hypothetical protein
MRDPTVHDELPERRPGRRRANPAVATAMASPGKWVEYRTSTAKSAQVLGSQLRHGHLASVDPLHFDVEFRNNGDGTGTVYVRYHELARSPELMALSDQDLWIRLMENDRELATSDSDQGEAARLPLNDEAERRFGVAAMERVAAEALATHTSPDDLVAWAREGWAQLEALLHQEGAR